ncbi:unnamed protein product [Microthlaspi erraticum]|uniref:PUM-HD domain-containing protein n=1 Tax=Microthlaspi erraticum TaxID=1685480 RepID=A0A6D2JPG4_9BRAS|nr:unnamed protein product [Microthlaspi erraticum]
MVLIVILRYLVVLRQVIIRAQNLKVRPDFIPQKSFRTRSFYYSNKFPFFAHCVKRKEEEQAEYIACKSVNKSRNSKLLYEVNSIVLMEYVGELREIMWRELAEKLFDNVLPLSLQMYGCRVIQKAIEVVDLDQKFKMVKELDGHVMRCVRDQNGNHVVQKCIECVPEENIEFVISTFFGQVVTLSMRFASNVVEKCLTFGGPEKRELLLNEMLGTTDENEPLQAMMKDQFANYVVQIYSN